MHIDTRMFSCHCPRLLLNCLPSLCLLVFAGGWLASPNSTLKPGLLTPTLLSTPLVYTGVHYIIWICKWKRIINLNPPPSPLMMISTLLRIPVPCVFFGASRFAASWSKSHTLSLSLSPYLISLFPLVPLALALALFPAFPLSLFLSRVCPSQMWCESATWCWKIVWHLVRMPPGAVLSRSNTMESGAHCAMTMQIMIWSPESSAGKWGVLWTT